MKIGAPKETMNSEARVALTPESAQRLQKLGYECVVEAGAGLAASLPDAAYEAAGVTVVGSAAESLVLDNLQPSQSGACPLSNQN